MRLRLALSRDEKFIQAAAASEMLQNRSFLAPSYRSFRHAPAINPAVIPLSHKHRKAHTKIAVIQVFNFGFCESVAVSMPLAIKRLRYGKIKRSAFRAKCSIGNSALEADAHARRTVNLRVYLAIALRVPGLPSLRCPSVASQPTAPPQPPPHPRPPPAAARPAPALPAHCSPPHRPRSARSGPVRCA